MQNEVNENPIHVFDHAWNLLKIFEQAFTKNHHSTAIWVHDLRYQFPDSFYFTDNEYDQYEKILIQERLIDEFASGCRINSEGIYALSDFKSLRDYKNRFKSINNTNQIFNSGNIIDSSIASGDHSQSSIIKNPESTKKKLVDTLTGRIIIIVIAGLLLAYLVVQFGLK